MKRPSATWEAVYKADRRKHHHRCRACNRIIATGERALMARAARGTVAVHLDCADMQVVDGHTYRDSMEAWGLAGLKARGWRVPELDTHYAR